jgi:type II secretory pathway pseudopilin PulG
MLVVITIIAILAALLIPAVISAQRRAQSTRIKMEIDQLATGFEDYRNDVAGEYPPNCWFVNAQNHTANAVVRHFKKAFPRHREPEALIRGLAGYGTDPLPGGLSPAEAVYFWLGGFSSDPKYPISGPGGPSFLISQADNIEDRNRTYDFDLARLGAGAGIDVKTALANGPALEITATQAINDNKVRAVQYPIGNQTRQINFWQYYPPKSTKPFVYFDTSKSRPSTTEDTFYFTSFGIVPIKRLAVDGLDIRYANEDKYQILHAGVDDDWGDFTQVGTIMYPDGPFTAELGDTVVNFDERTLQDAQP